MTKFWYKFLCNKKWSAVKAKQTAHQWSVSRDITIANSGCGSGSPVDGYEVVMKGCGAWRYFVLCSPAFILAAIYIIL